MIVKSVAQKAIHFLKPICFGLELTVFKLSRTVFLTLFVLKYSWSIKGHKFHYSKYKVAYLFLLG